MHFSLRFDTTLADASIALANKWAAVKVHIYNCGNVILCMYTYMYFRTWHQLVTSFLRMT